MKARVLVVEDVRAQALLLRRILEREGHEVTVASDEVGAQAEILGRHYDLVIADLVLSDDLSSDGLALFRKVHAELGDEAPVFVILTAYGTVESARNALKAGVYDYLTKPINPTELSVLVKHALEYRRLQRENRALNAAVVAQRMEERLIGTSSAFKRMLVLTKAAAASSATILIRGESGTGKELIAELIHATSARCREAFVKVNCAAIPENLLEAELFGHEAGAYTDAHTARAGRFELAHRGTILLDEIAEMSPPLQVKLLRVLQERQLERLGGQGQTIDLDIRLIAATNRDLEAMVREGTFREDLYYRINVITIQSPPLRERRQDVGLLANHFCARFNEKNRKRFEGLAPEAHELLRRHGWPGNVRELENVIERAVVLGRGEWILPEHLPPAIQAGSPAGSRRAFEVVAQALDAGMSLEDFGRRMIERALERSAGNVSAAARQLGLTRRTLQYRMRRDGIERSQVGS